MDCGRCGNPMYKCACDDWIRNNDGDEPRQHAEVTHGRRQVQADTRREEVRSYNRESNFYEVIK